eukprot:scaffold25942_cov32-Tisochrysis_lutea.AAC.1
MPSLQGYLPARGAQLEADRRIRSSTPTRAGATLRAQHARRQSPPCPPQGRLLLDCMLLGQAGRGRHGRQSERGPGTPAATLRDGRQTARSARSGARAHAAAPRATAADAYRPPPPRQATQPP